MNTKALISEVGDAPKSWARRAVVSHIVVPRAPTSWNERGLERGAAVYVFEGPGLTPSSSTSPEAALDLSGLVERVAVNADRAAFALLFAFYAPRVKGYLLRLGLDGARAEELSQEVMVAVWRKAVTYDRGQGSVSTWIFRIARNRRIDLFRREQRAALDANDPAFQPDAEPAPDGVAEATDREAQVRRVLANLPPEQHQLVRAAYYEELSHSQIADKTGIPLGTVKSRLRLAFAKLKLGIEAEDSRFPEGRT